MTAPFQPTHQAPPAGLDTWEEPDAAAPPGPRLPGRLPVRRLRAWGDWSRVVCSNGWEAWVDGRQLEPIGAPRPAGLDRSPIRVRGMAVTAPLVGAAAALVSCFLPWFSINGIGVSAFDVPLKFLVDKDDVPVVFLGGAVAGGGGVALGWLLVTVAAGAAALVVRPINVALRRALGWVLVLIATVFLAQTQRLVGQLQAGGVFSSLGLGVYVSAVAGWLIARGGGEPR